MSSAGMLSTRASFDSDKQTCMQAVNSASFLDPAAAAACGNMSFGGNIAACINAIAGKSFVPGRKFRKAIAEAADPGDQMGAGQRD